MTGEILRIAWEGSVRREYGGYGVPGMKSREDVGLPRG